MSHSFRQITPTDKFGWHQQLLPVYQRLFANLSWWQDAVDGGDCMQTKRLLEIGTDGGGGLLMYEDHFPRWEIHGCDHYFRPQGIEDKPNIHDHNLDAYKPATVEHFFEIGQFDIIIDDGPHSLESQEFFAQHYPPLLAADGIAIIEDIQAPAYVERLAAKVPPGFFSFAVDMRHVEPKRYDNHIFCIQRQ